MLSAAKHLTRFGLNRAAYEILRCAQNDQEFCKLFAGHYTRVVFRKYLALSVPEQPEEYDLRKFVTLSEAKGLMRIT
jgi:hypothetical protein